MSTTPESKQPVENEKISGTTGLSGCRWGTIMQKENEPTERLHWKSVDGIVLISAVSEQRPERFDMALDQRMSFKASPTPVLKAGKDRIRREPRMEGSI